jgi:hypothetical protein
MMEKINFKKLVVLLMHGVVAWALCGSIIAVGRGLTSMENTLIIHAFGAPIIAVAVSLVYFKIFNYTRPLQTAIAFLAVIVLMDVFVVALLIEKSFEMFTSVIGTWLPWALISTATYSTGRYARKQSETTIVA